MKVIELPGHVRSGSVPPGNTIGVDPGAAASSTPMLLRPPNRNVRRCDGWRVVRGPVDGASTGRPKRIDVRVPSLRRSKP